MMSFKKYLAESYNYSLNDVELDNYSDEPGLLQLDPEQIKIYTKFITLLGRWLDGAPFSKASQLNLISLTDQIDQKIVQNKGPTKLYRGILFDSKEEFESNNFLFPDKLEYKPTRPIESWTTSKNIAKNFATRFGTASARDISIIIEKTFNPNDILMNVLNVVTNKKLIKIAQSLLKERFSREAEGMAEEELEALVKNKSKSIIKLDKIYHL